MENTDHVLIVDDDRGIRELIATYLEKNGMRVSLAANGRQMRAVLEQGAPDLIVLDLMMPGEDGLVLCRELRAGKFRAVPVLMLTARSEETDRIVGLEMGADDYLSKPFAVRELLARIRSVLRRARMLPPGMQVSGNVADDQLRRLAARHDRAPSARRRGHHGGAQRRGVPAAARVPRSSAARTHAGSIAQPDPGPPGRCVRSLDRPAGQPLAAALAATTRASRVTSRRCAAKATCSPPP